MTDAPGPKAADADRIAQGYQVDGAALEFGTVVLDGTAYPQAQIRVPLSMVNRHGLIAGATGTGKTKTLQGLAEQLSAAGVPVVVADIKGDLSGLAQPGAAERQDRAAGRGHRRHRLAARPPSRSSSSHSAGSAPASRCGPR